MRILTWNVNHRTAQRKIPTHMADAICSLDPDVVVLTEYVPGPTRQNFMDGLSSAGLNHQQITTFTPRENHICIASRMAIEAGAIKAPAIAPSVPSNALHVKIPEAGIDVLGLRIPDYSKEPVIRRACWDWIIQAATHLVNRPSVLIGDFNTDPTYPPSRCGYQIQTLIDQGWQHVVPSGEPSYWTPKGHGVQIDHAFVTRHLKAPAKRFVREHDEYVFVGEQGGMSDHAVLVVDLIIP